MKTLQRLLVVFAFAIAGLFVSSATLATPAYACGYYTGYDDCGKPPLWDNLKSDPYKPSTKKNPGRHPSFDLKATQQRKCPLWCGEGYAQRNFKKPEPLFKSYPQWYDVDPGKASGGTGKCSNGGPSLLGWCP